MTDKRLSNEMTNSHILVQDFDYIEPKTVSEVVKLLEAYGKRAQVMAGGTHLLTMLKMERDAPKAIISLNMVDEIKGVSSTDEGGVLIGAGTTIYTLRTHPTIQANYPALSEACESFGSTQIQIMGTIGGNLCNGSPASDTVPALMIYDAKIVLKGKEERILPLEKFLLGPGKTAKKDNEILTGIILLPAPEKSASVFVKVSRVAADLAKASLAVLLVRDGEKITGCKIACGSVAPTVLRLKKAETVLNGQVFTEEMVKAAAGIAAEEISPIDDIRSNAWYRRQLMSVMVYDALHRAWERLDEKKPKSNKPVPKATKTLQGIKHHNIKSGEMQDVVLTVNGRKHTMRVAANDLLINVLRDTLDLRGAKYGCGLGECGACTVLMDGKAVLSCLVIAASAEGHDIVTVEGLQKPDGELDLLQKDFVDEAAFQCGYCTPGFIMTAKSLMADLQKPSEEQIRDYLKGNRCRCTGYASIMRAVIKSVQRQSP